MNSEKSESYYLHLSFRQMYFFALMKNCYRPTLYIKRYLLVYMSHVAMNRMVWLVYLSPFYALHDLSLKKKDSSASFQMDCMPEEGYKMSQLKCCSNYKSKKKNEFNNLNNPIIYWSLKDLWNLWTFKKYFIKTLISTTTKCLFQLKHTYFLKIAFHYYYYYFISHSFVYKEWH